MDSLSSPSGVSLKRLNIKNNLAELYLKKQLDQYKREKTFSISHIDRDRFDTRDFLKQVKKIESDNNHAAVA
jgi:predicted adenine nucleotide alpha hydrolase (AANH) superfamily ATPase